MKLEEKRVALVVFGEVLYDVFPDGRRVLGGAPFNVAWALQGFGEAPYFVSGIGDDEEGLAVRERMERFGLATEGLQCIAGKRTGEVEVRIEDNEPSYLICADRAWDCVEDEGIVGEGLLYHGLLATRCATTRRTLKALIERSPAQRFMDINLRPPHVDREVLEGLMRGVDWLKLNIDELAWLLGRRGLVFKDCRSAVSELRETYAVKTVLLTAGAEGALIQGAYGEAMCQPAPKADPFTDTVGAGDAFAAAIIRGILKKAAPDSLLSVASTFAAKVCGLRGATSVDPSFYG
jgi:fructokinase